MVSETDPAEDDLELKKKLDESGKQLNQALNRVKLNNSAQYYCKQRLCFCRGFFVKTKLKIETKKIIFTGCITKV